MKSPSDVDRMVGGRVRAARLSSGMSQEALARAVGVTFQQVQKYEKGTNRLSAGRLHQIAAALGVGVSDLAGEREAGGSGGGPLGAFLSTAGADELVDLWMRMDASGRVAALEGIRMLLGTPG